MSLNDLMNASTLGGQGGDLKSVAKSLVEPAQKTDDTRKGPGERRTSSEAREPLRNRQREDFERQQQTPDEGDDDKDDDDNSRATVEDEGGEDDDRGTTQRQQRDDGDDDDGETTQKEGEDEDADTSTDDEGEDDGYEELTDETLIPVTIDGEETELTLAELKRRAAGEGAIERRLQEATELRREVEQERQKHQQDVEHDRTVITTALSLFQNHLFHPQVQQPDPALQQTNPQEYQRHMQAFQQDQMRVQQATQQFGAVIQHFQAQQEQEKQQLRMKQAALLRDKMPVFKDPVQGPKMRERIIKTAGYYGFKPEDVAQAVDHRLFLMAADAAAYRELMDQQKKGGKKPSAGGKEPPKKGEKRIRTMRSGSKPGSSQNRVAKQTRELEKRARETGDVKDVALTLIQPAPRRR